MMSEDEAPSHTEEWLEMAERDFDDAVFNINHGRKHPGVVFLQQAVEKALKARIIYSGDEPAYTHNLMSLAEDAGLPDEKREYFPRLTNLYTGVRYPGESVEEIENLDTIIASVEEVIAWTNKQLKK